MLPDADLFRAFEDTTLESLPHRDHVRLGWLFVRRDGVIRALTTFGEALTRYADAKGKSGLYHVTITWAYLFLIDERMRKGDQPDSNAFAEAHAELLAWSPSILDRFYTKERLWSAEARAAFVLPDRLSDHPA